MTTTAYNLGNILGAQIRSVLEAEAENAEAIAEFITTVGFEKNDQQSGLGNLRLIEFQMQRRDEAGGLQIHTIKIPLLSILPIPMLSIEKADFEFDLKIHDVIKRKMDSQELTHTKVLPKSLVATFSRNRKVPNNSGSSEKRIDSNMSVKVSVVQTDFPLGVEKLLNVAEIAVQDVVANEGSS